MRARHREAPEGTGAEHGRRHGLVGIGDALDVAPATLDEAVQATRRAHGEKAARMLQRFALAREGSFVWTRGTDGSYHLGRIAGPWHYDDSAAARLVGIHHVRPAQWLNRSFGEHGVPAAVAATFARGGRNFQRTHAAEAERRTAQIWNAHRRSTQARSTPRR